MSRSSATVVSIPGFSPLKCPIVGAETARQSREIAITLYEKTIDFVRHLISERGLQPGDRLPSEVEVATMAGVSLMTVRRAMAELVAAGVLQRVQGKGTFLRPARIHTESTIIGGLKKTLALQGTRLDTKLISLQETRADDESAERLSIPAGTAVWDITRLRSFDGEPVVRERAVIPRILAPDLDTYFSPATQSLYDVLTAQYGLAESIEEQTLIARPATPVEQKELALGRTNFVVEVTGVSVTASGTAFDSFQMVFVPHKFAFRLRSSPLAEPLEVSATTR